MRKAGNACSRTGSRSLSCQAGRIRGVAANIGKAAGLPVEFTDERLSSQEAKRSLRESGMSERDMRGKIDMIAASVFLQAWLDARHAGER